MGGFIQNSIKSEYSYIQNFVFLQLNLSAYFTYIWLNYYCNDIISLINLSFLDEVIFIEIPKENVKVKIFFKLRIGCS